MSQYRLFLLTALLLILPAAARGQTDIPRTIAHQGLLTDASTGNPVADGNYNVTFRLYKSAAAGSPIWTETQSVATTDGIYNAILGNVTPLDAVTFNGELWLSHQIAPDAEMADRTELTSVPYAMGLALPFADTVASDVPLIQLDNSGTSDGILVTNTGSGTAGAFLQVEPTSGNSGVYGQSNGLGAAVFGQHFGTGHAGRFVVANAASDSAALYVETTGTGPGAVVKNGRVEVEFDSQLGDPHVLIRETSAGDFARLSLRNDDNLNYWDIAAGGASNVALNFFRDGTGDVMSLRSNGRVGIGTGTPDQRLHVDGAVKADSLVYNAPRAASATVYGGGFVPFIQSSTVEYARNGGFHFTSGSVKTALGAIQFPDNAHLESLTCFIFDATISENLTCQLCQESSGSSCTLLGEVTSNDVSGAWDAYSTPLTMPVTVDNDTQSYFALVLTEGATNWSTYASNLQIVRLTVGYTVDQAP